MPVTHESWLVVLSLFVAVQGSYVGLSLAVQVRDAFALRRKFLLAGSAISLAVAIWSMHFVGMLAARMPLPVDYLVFPTLLSFLVCVLVVGTAVFAAGAGPLTPLRLAASAIFMGGGIVSMHYIGMTALHSSAHMEHSILFVAMSAAFAIVASGFALWLAAGRGMHPPLIVSAAVLGIAIAGMHYTAMAGLTLFFPHTTAPITSPAISSDLLAIVVAIVAFLVSGIFLLILVPDRSAGAASRSVTARTAAELPAGPDIGKGTFSPLRGVGGPPSRPAQHLPVEREGVTQYIRVEDVIAVHANAHYTYVYDGAAKLFSPLATGDAESRLDPERFFRVHRSHIVNIDRVTAVKRSGDSGIVELNAPENYSVPISRNRIGPLKSRMKTRVGQVA